MRILLIENQPYASQITSKRNDITAYDGSLSQSVEVVAEDIKIRYGKLADVFIINTHLQIGNAPLSENAGIKLLKLLRLHYIDTHVVLYSWMSREMLMRDLRNAIIFSKGVSFCRLPDFLNVIQGINFTALSNEKAEKHELLQLFRAEYDPDDRHFSANIFGIWQLMRVQDAYDRLFGGGIGPKKDDETRKIINDYLNSYNGRLVQYINGQDAINLEEKLREEINLYNEKTRCEKLQQSLEAIKDIENELDDIQIQIVAINKLISTHSNADEGKDQNGLFHWVQRRAKEIADEKLSRLAIAETKELVGRKVMLQKEKQRHINIKNWAEEPSSQPIDDYDNNGFDDVTIKKIRETLNNRRPRIIYVDDMAEKGWANILKQIIYKNEEDYKRLTSIVPDRNDDVETIVHKICAIENPHLIILDLRLKDEYGYYAPADLSGFQVLKALDKKNLPCAILIFTASNKVWSLKEAFKGNVMSYWIKEGLDRADGIEDSVNDYLDLITQINTLTRVKGVFEYLAELKTMAKEINEAQQLFWWETLEAKFEYRDENGISIYHRKLTQKEDIISNLNMVVEFTQSSLRQMYFQTGDFSLSDIYNMMVIQLAYIVEEILRCNESLMDPCSLFYKIGVCAPDAKIRNITIPRNGASHRRYSHITDAEIIDYIAAIREFLFNKPSSSTGSNLQTNEEKTNLPGTNDIEETPLIERQNRLKNGETITVKVIEKTSYMRDDEIVGWFYNFYLNKFKTMQGSLLYKSNLDHQEFIANIEEGDYIEVILDGETKNGKPCCRIANYHKKSECVGESNELSS